ncbi:MAG: 3-deoxy-D-manno-octulosonic acid kinase [Puniceicoccaceae bacterium]
MRTLIQAGSGYERNPEELFALESQGGGEITRGRARIVFFSLGGRDYVRKHYARGGFVRHLISDRYAFSGLERTRMWREFRLLQRLRQMDLPVPEPAAVRCVLHTPFTYSGELVTRRLPGAETLGAILRRQALPPGIWTSIGRTIGRFHRQSVYHSDLNIENIMLDPESRIFLLDFDKGSIRPGRRKTWMRRNLDRLHRSLRKAHDHSESFHFAPDDWSRLIDGHQGRPPE